MVLLVSDYDLQQGGENMDCQIGNSVYKGIDKGLHFLVVWLTSNSAQFNASLTLQLTPSRCKVLNILNSCACHNFILLFRLRFNFRIASDQSSYSACV